jgi:hypothetical protein
MSLSVPGLGGEVEERGTDYVVFVTVCALSGG